MRLICPSCGAQYEVPSEAVPPAGRDVQCSACGHTWFESPPVPELLPDDEPWDRVPRVADDEEEADDLAEVLAAPPPLAPPRSTVTPDVAEILRSEAAREAQVRAEETARQAVPVAAVTPFPETPPPAPEADRAPEAPRTSPEPPTPPEPPRRPEPPARRAELDLDQINSNLRSTADRLGAKAPRIEPPRRRGGFARGFVGALLVAALLAILYGAAPRIVAAVPQAGLVLDPYVAAVDRARLWLDRRVGDPLSARLPTEGAPAE